MEKPSYTKGVLLAFIQYMINKYLCPGIAYRR